MSVNAESEEHTKETVIDITSDSEEIVEAGTEEAAESRSCSRSVYYREGYRMREVCVRLSDISKTMSTPGSLNTSPAPVKRGRGRPRKSVSVSTPGLEEKSSPKITSFFKKKGLQESENSSACESLVKIRFSSPAKTAHLSETSLNSPSQRTQVKKTRKGMFRYQCNNGYKLFGQSRVYCTKQGWNILSPPFCSSKSAANVKLVKYS